jgi:hypothetical protein
LHGPERTNAVPVHKHVHVNDHENDDRSSFSILDRRSSPFHRGTALTKAAVVDVHVFVEVDVDGIFSRGI